MDFSDSLDDSGSLRTLKTGTLHKSVPKFKLESRARKNQDRSKKNKINRKTVSSTVDPSISVFTKSKSKPISPDQHSILLHEDINILSDSSSPGQSRHKKPVIPLLDFSKLQTSEEPLQIQISRPIKKAHPPKKINKKKRAASVTRKPPKIDSGDIWETKKSSRKRVSILNRLDLISDSSFDAQHDKSPRTEVFEEFSVSSMLESIGTQTKFPIFHISEPISYTLVGSFVQHDRINYSLPAIPGDNLTSITPGSDFFSFKPRSLSDRMHIIGWHGIGIDSLQICKCLMRLKSVNGIGHYLSEWVALYPDDFLPKHAEFRLKIDKVVSRLDRIEAASLRSLMGKTSSCYIHPISLKHSFAEATTDEIVFHLTAALLKCMNTETECLDETVASIIKDGNLKKWAAVEQRAIDFRNFELAFAIRIAFGKLFKFEDGGHETRMLMQDTKYYEETVKEVPKITVPYFSPMLAEIKKIRQKYQKETKEWSINVEMMKSYASVKEGLLWGWGKSLQLAIDEKMLHEAYKFVGYEK